MQKESSERRNEFVGLGVRVGRRNWRSHADSANSVIRFHLTCQSPASAVALLKSTTRTGTARLKILNVFANSRSHRTVTSGLLNHLIRRSGFTPPAEPME